MMEKLEIPMPESGMAIDMPDYYAKFNLEQQANKKIYSVDCRGRFDVRPLDRLLYFTEKGEIRIGIVIEHSLSYNGAMKSMLRILDEAPAPRLYCSQAVLCSETAICRGSEEWVWQDSVLLWNGLTSHLSGNIGELSISGWDSIVLVVCDENGENIRTLEFDNLEYTVTEGTILTSAITVGSRRYDLWIDESWSPAGNNLDGYCSVTIGENVQLIYVKKIYGVSKGE